MGRQMPLRRAIGSAALASSLLAAAPWASVPWAVGAAAPAHAIAGLPGIPSYGCFGSHDLNVAGGTVSLQGGHTYDRVCITSGGTLMTTGLALRTGLLYIDATGSINADPAYDFVNPICGQDGSPAGIISVVAGTIVVEGSIEANGGAGGNPDCNGGVLTAGAGGAVTLQANVVQLLGTISADGGAAQDLVHLGGAGGSVTICTAAPLPRAAAHIQAEGGTGFGTRSGPAGHVALNTLTPAEVASLPPAPGPLVQVLGQAPARLAPLQPSIMAQGMACGPGDLDIGARRVQRLVGIHRYAHVCVHDGGVLDAGPRLTLVAGTILVGAGSRIDAGGVLEPAPGVPATGRYTGTSWPRATLPAGVPGPRGDGSGVDPLAGSGAQPVPGPAGGAGGGSLTLVASRMLIAGTVSADGAEGGDGGQGGVSGRSIGNIPATGGAGGGSGGGIFLVAHSLQLTGLLSARGGAAGQPGYGAVSQPPGGAGQLTLLVDQLYAPPGDLALAGAATIGHTLPVDPVPGYGIAGSLYFSAFMHTLSGAFLAFWKTHGGMAVLGSARTEPFVANGHLEQYTEHVLLVLDKGQVQTAPLGRMLTAGRHFPTVRAFKSTAGKRYFPSTGHSLSGPYLAYWLTHDGAAVLGAPISEVVVEGNGDGSGRRYALQWFERGRLDYHPELARTSQPVEMGPLGTQAMQQRGWLPGNR